MQLRCAHCTRTIAIAPDGALPATCPHCHGAAVPAELGDYRPERLLACGGMGEVYVAHHRELGTRVAIKVLPAMPLDAIPALRQRFAREARLTARVHHPGVVRVLHSDASGDRPYLVLELVDGETLRSRLERGPLPCAEAARVTALAADVLAAAHAEGVLHRDVKPDNVMVTAAGEVRLLDFGIARALSDDAPLTRTGEIVGTPEYMAPEQLLDGPEATDARTDVHALGTLLHELLTGRSPFRGANVFQTLKLVESLVPEPPSRHAPLVPAALDAVVARALEKQPSDRFPGAAAMARALREAVPTAAPSAARATPSWSRTVAAVVLLFGIAAPVVAWQVATRRADSDARTPDHDAHAAVDPIATRRRARTDALEAGRWNEALTTALRDLDDGDTDAVADARDAFVLATAAWAFAADLPPWLAATDDARARRLFGDDLEPVAQAGDPHRALLRGEPAAWRDWLAAEGTPSSAVRLAAIASLPAAERADAFAAWALRVPIEAPEHWLARVVERHLRGDRAGATQAAEMAWLSGAGELAVLLDAALGSGVATAGAPEVHAPQALLRWRRVAGADATDCPASTLLLLWLEARHGFGDGFDPAPARAFPRRRYGDAGAWFAAAAPDASEHARVPLLRVAIALGARPDLDAEPWRELPEALRKRIEEELEHGR